MKEIDDQNIFEPEPEPTVEELLENVPEPMANYLKATNKMLKDFQPKPLRMDSAGYPLPFGIPPKIEFEFLVKQWEIGRDYLSDEMTAFLNLGWSIRATEHYDKWLVVIFVREKEKVDTGKVDTELIPD